MNVVSTHNQLIQRAADKLRVSAPYVLHELVR